MWSALPSLGAGISVQHEFLAGIRLFKDDIHVLEIMPERYSNLTRHDRDELEELRSFAPLVAHSVGLSIGSARGIDENYVRWIKNFLKVVKPLYWSDHLSFTKAGPYQSANFISLPCTEDALHVVVRNIRQIRHIVKDVPFVLENVAAMFLMDGEMSEADFISRVAQEGDCGILLDITNLYTNCYNRGGDPDFYLDRLPPERIVEYHLAGGIMRDGFLLDSHSEQVPSEIWRWMADAETRWHAATVIVERDSNFPEFDILMKDVLRAHAVWEGGI